MIICEAFTLKVKLKIKCLPRKQYTVDFLSVWIYVLIWSKLDYQKDKIQPVVCGQLCSSFWLVGDIMAIKSPLLSPTQNYKADANGFPIQLPVITVWTMTRHFTSHCDFIRDSVMSWFQSQNYPLLWVFNFDSPQVLELHAQNFIDQTANQLIGKIIDNEDNG